MEQQNAADDDTTRTGWNSDEKLFGPFFLSLIASFFISVLRLSFSRQFQWKWYNIIFIMLVTRETWTKFKDFQW